MSIQINELNTFCQNYVVPTVVNNILYSAALLFRLMKKQKTFTGSTYDAPIFFAKNTNAEDYGATDQLTNAITTEATKARYSPVLYNAAIKVTGLSLEQNKGPTKVLDLVKEKMKIAESSLKDLFATDLIADQAGDKMDGLGLVCKTGTTTLGGIGSGDAAEWKSSSGYNGPGDGPDSTSTSLTRLALDKQFNSCKIDEDKPTLIATTDDLWAGISSVHLQPNLRYTDTKMADLGFENFKYRGALVITDSHIAANSLYTLNEKHLYFASYPGMRFKFIPFHVLHDYDMMVAHIRWYGQLITDSRRSQGWMSALTGVA